MRLKIEIEPPEQSKALPLTGTSETCYDTRNKQHANNKKNELHVPIEQRSNEVNCVLLCNTILYTLIYSNNLQMQNKHAYIALLLTLSNNLLVNHINYF